MFSQRAAVADIVRDIDRDFISFRRYVREYAASGEESIAKSANERRARVKGYAERALKEVKNPERLAAVKHLSEQFEVYANDFDKLAILRREQLKLTKDVLDPTGATLRNEIEQLQSGAASKQGDSNSVILAGEALKHPHGRAVSVSLTSSWDAMKCRGTGGRKGVQRS